MVHCRVVRVIFGVELRLVGYSCSVSFNFLILLAELGLGRLLVWRP